MMYGISIVVYLLEMLTVEGKCGTGVWLLGPHFRLDRIITMPEASVGWRVYMASCGVGT
jgi:hypothetical protein